MKLTKGMKKMRETVMKTLKEALIYRDTYILFTRSEETEKAFRNRCDRIAEITGSETEKVYDALWNNSVISDQDAVFALREIGIDL